MQAAKQAADTLSVVVELKSGMAPETPPVTVYREPVNHTDNIAAQITSD